MNNLRTLLRTYNNWSHLPFESRININGLPMMASFMFSTVNELIVKHNQTNNEFYIQLGNDKAILNYRNVRKGVLDLYHTEVPPALQGKGIAAKLAKEAFNYVVDHNLNMIVSCTYLQKYLSQNPNQEYTERVVK